MLSIVWCFLCKTAYREEQQRVSSAITQDFFGGHALFASLHVGEQTRGVPRFGSRRSWSHLPQPVAIIVIIIPPSNYILFQGFQTPKKNPFATTAGIATCRGTSANKLVVCFGLKVDVDYHPVVLITPALTNVFRGFSNALRRIISPTGTADVVNIHLHSLYAIYAFLCFPRYRT